jgi:hypothetical protein
MTDVQSRPAPTAPKRFTLDHPDLGTTYPVNVFKQPRIPDSGAAFFDMVAEPAI